MTRHGRNATASAVYSYHERSKNTREGGYGTLRARLSKDSMKHFDCCSLTLQPCKDPVITPDGFVFDKESILEYLVHQKAEIARKMKAYDKQKNREKEEMKELSEAERMSKAEKFMEQEASIASKDPFKRRPVSDAASSMSSASSSSASLASTSSSSTVSNVNSGLPSFWVPSLTPDQKPTEVKKPDKTVYCPMSGKALKMKDLFSFQFTKVQDRDEKTAEIVKDVRYMCAVTHDILTNSIPCAVLKTSGKVVTMECVEKIIKKEMLDPITGVTLKEADIIPIKGGTGYASSGVELKASKATSVMQ